jgi:transglutaminase-like putative cysteine protease
MCLKLSRKIIIGGLILGIAGCSSDFSRVKDHYERITQKYEKRLAARPGNEKVRVKLAQFYYEFRDYQRVRELLEEIEDRKAKIILAKAMAEAKDFDYAIEIFEQVKDSVKDNEYLYLYGKVLEEKNLFPKAVKIYSKVRGKFAGLAEERISLIKSKVAEDVPKQIIQIAEEAKEFLKDIENEAAITFLVDEKADIRPDNTAVSSVHVIEQVLKERGKELAEVEVGYDSTYERVELEFARAISKDGKMVYAGKENIRDVSRYLNFPLYSNARVFIVSMPLVDVGSVIEYKIKIYSSKLMNGDDFNFTYRLREKYPIFKAKFELSVPKNKKLNFKNFNEEYVDQHELKPTVKKDKRKAVYKWEFNKIKPLIPEYNMPPVSDINPAVLISSFSSWNQIYDWWKEMYEDKFLLDKETKKFVKSLIKGSKTDFEKAKKLYEFCAKNIRYVAVEYGESGYEPHSAQEVFINRYGDCKDQAILLVSMLKLAGVKAYPVLIPTRSVYEIDKGFPSASFNHAICAVEVDGELIFMDPTAETTSFMNLPLGDQDRDAMVFLNKGWKIVKTPQIADNEILYKMNIGINAEENAVIEREVTSRGFFTSIHRAYLKYTHPSKIKEDIQDKMVQISSFSRLVNYEIENVDDFDKSPVLKYKFETEKFLNPAGNLRIVPVLNEIYIENNLIGKEKRDFPLDFEGLHARKAEIQIKLPVDLAVQYLPEDINLENKWFIFTSVYSVSAEVIKFSQKFQVNQRFVEQSDYEEFKRELEKVLYLLREEIILAKQ